MTGIDTSNPFESLNKSEAAMLRLFRASNAEVQQFFLGMAEDLSRKYPASPKTQLRLVSGGFEQGERVRNTSRVRATRSNNKSSARLRLSMSEGSNT